MLQKTKAGQSIGDRSTDNLEGINQARKQTDRRRVCIIPGRAGNFADPRFKIKRLKKNFIIEDESIRIVLVGYLG